MLYRMGLTVQFTFFKEHSNESSWTALSQFHLVRNISTNDFLPRLLALRTLDREIFQLWSTDISLFTCFYGRLLSKLLILPQHCSSTGVWSPLEQWPIGLCIIWKKYEQDGNIPNTCIVLNVMSYTPSKAISVENKMKSQPPLLRFCGDCPQPEK